MKLTMIRIPGLATLSLSALMLGGALVATAGADRTPSLLVQAEQKAVTITGTCIGSDGQPAAKLEVAVMFSRPQKPAGNNDGGGQGSGPGDPGQLAARLQGQNEPPQQRGRWTVAGKAVTDASGKFTINGVREQGSLRVDVGDKFKSDWKIISNVQNNGQKPLIDLGQIKLDARLESK